MWTLLLEQNLWFREDGAQCFWVTNDISSALASQDNWSQGSHWCEQEADLAGLKHQVNLTFLLCYCVGFREKNLHRIDGYFTSLNWLVKHLLFWQYRLLYGCVLYFFSEEHTPGGQVLSCTKKTELFCSDCITFFWPFLPGLPLWRTQGIRRDREADQWICFGCIFPFHAALYRDSLSSLFVDHVGFFIVCDLRGLGTIL